MEVLSISEARKNLSSLVQKLDTSESSPIYINVRGKDAAVLLSTKEYDRLRFQVLDQEISSIFHDFDDLNKALSKR